MAGANEESGKTMVAFGQVVTVRPVPTLQVNQIIIEIPDHFQVAATQMLFGKDAFVLTASGVKGSYGVVPLDVETLGGDMEMPMAAEVPEKASARRVELQRGFAALRAIPSPGLNPRACRAFWSTPGQGLPENSASECDWHVRKVAQRGLVEAIRLVDTNRGHP